MAKYQNDSGRQWAGLMSRSAKRAALNLGIIQGEKPKVQEFRRPELEDFDKYYENRQYDHLMDWEEANTASCEGDFVGIRKRKPRIVINMAKTFASRVGSKLVGAQTFPKFEIENDPDTSELLRLMLKMTSLQARLAEPMRRLVVSGSVFVRFSAMVNPETNEGAVKVEHYLSKYCYPQFDNLGDLTFVRIQYTYCDPMDLDEKGKPRKKWYRMDLGKMADTLFDNPIYDPNATPMFQVVETVQHDLGFVQGEWFRTAEDKHVPDGPSLLEDNLDIIDEINYSSSQSSQAIGYNQEPQLTVKGMDADEMEHLVKSSTKAWNLGRDGEAGFVESDLGAVKTAMEFRDKVRLAFQDTTRVILHDPEKMDGNALSGKAMEITQAPFVDLIEELRPIIEEQLTSLLLKITFTVLQLTKSGVNFGLAIPESYVPQSFDISVKWPSVFPMTMTDLKEKLNVGLQASNANIISRETVLKWVAPDFGIEDIEEELAKIAAQPVINPFGAF